MLLSNLTKRWSAGLWKLFRPTEIIRGLVDGFRIGLSSLSTLHELATASKLPVSIGSGYEVLTVPMNRISKNVPVAGVSGLSTAQYPYIITGIPSGIIYFCRSLVSVGGSLYYNYVEKDGVYYFKEDPTKYGVIQARGELRCSFIVFNPKKRTLGLQDLGKTFSESTDHFVNCEIRKHDEESGITNGINQKLINASAGVKSSTEELSRVWVEGGKLFAIATDGELLRDYLQSEEGIPGATLNSGVIYTGDDDYQYFSEDSDIISAKQKEGIVSIDTTNGPADPGAQRAILERIDQVSTFVLYQRMYIKAPANATGMYVFFDDVNNSDTPCVCAGMKPRDVVLNNAGAFGVSRITFPENSKTVVSNYKEEYGQHLMCGKYIKAISFVDAGKRLADDVILSHIQVESTLVHAGGCVVFFLQ